MIFDIFVGMMLLLNFAGVVLTLSAVGHLLDRVRNAASSQAVLTVDMAKVLISAHQQALLTQPDPSIAKKGLLRVPLGEGEIGYSAADWTNCWRMGAIDFSDEYALSHHGRQPDEAHLKKIGDYLYVNRLDPASVQNWQTAYSRLSAAGVIQDITWQEIANAMPVKDKPQAPKFIDIEKMPSRTTEE